VTQQQTRPAPDPRPIPGAAPSIAAAGAGLVLAALPVFLVGGLAVQIRAELGFSEAALGAAVSAAFLTGACAGPLGGRLADRVGARIAVLAGGACSVVALLGIALLAERFWHVAVLLAVSGAGFAVTDPGLAILLQGGVPQRLQGLAFGVKEASIPTATLAAGLAVPVIALTLGWRYAFAIGVVPVVALAALLPRVTARRPVRTQTHGETDVAPLPRPVVLLVVVGAALGIAAASGVGVFLTQSAVAMGVSPGGAGLLLAVASAAGIAARMGTGLLADRRGGQQLSLIAWMLLAGAVSMVIGATGVPSLLIVGSMGVFAAAWGWSGLLFLSLVRASPANPGAAAGIGVAGLAAGNGLGPLGFGVIAAQWSFADAWLVSAVAAALAAGLMWAARPAFAASATAAAGGTPHAEGVAGRS